MKSKDVKIGMKVTPIRKTVKGYYGLGSSAIWKDARAAKHNYLYVKEYDEELKVWVLVANSRGWGGGDFFHARDFFPYQVKARNSHR